MVEETEMDPVQNCWCERQGIDEMRALQMVLARKRQIWTELANKDFTPFLSIISRFVYQQDKAEKRRCDVETPSDSEMNDSENSDASAWEIALEEVEIVSEEDA